MREAAMEGRDDVREVHEVTTGDAHRIMPPDRRSQHTHHTPPPTHHETLDDEFVRGVATLAYLVLPHVASTPDVGSSTAGLGRSSGVHGTQVTCRTSSYTAGCATLLPSLNIRLRSLLVHPQRARSECWLV